ncbi:hypothetical protein ScPMuIL_015275 [Solemya velum]
MFSKGFLTPFVTGVLGSAAFYTVFDKISHKSRVDPEKFDFLKVPEDSSVLEDTKKLEQARSILKYGAPSQGPYLRFYENHVLAYDQSKRTPIWVAEYLTKANVEGPANRKNVKFRPDPNVTVMYTAHNSDYLGSGWSRGHMSPAGDNKHSQEAMRESFYLSNVVPQDLQNNGGFWNRLEMYCRDLTKTYQSIIIISGPLILPQERNGKQIVEYEVIGKSQVSVPTHLFKVVLAESDSMPTKPLGVFIVPNKPIGFEHSLTEFQVELEELERVAGVTFLPKLDRKQVSDLCKVNGCKLMKKEKFQLYFITRKIQSSRSIKHLDKVWGELEENKLQPDEYMVNLYNSKREELMNVEKDKSNVTK